MWDSDNLKIASFLQIPNYDLRHLIGPYCTMTMQIFSCKHMQSKIVLES